jgi:hypothetical protein
VGMVIGLCHVKAITMNLVIGLKLDMGIVGYQADGDKYPSSPLIEKNIKLKLLKKIFINDLIFNLWPKESDSNIT